MVLKVVHDHPLQDLFMRLTLEGICKVGFGVEIGTLSPSLPAIPFASNFDNANEAVTYRFFDPFWRLKQLFNIGNEAVLSRSVKVVDDFTYNVIRTRRVELQSTEGENKVRVFFSKPHHSFLIYSKFIDQHTRLQINLVSDSIAILLCNWQTSSL